jgi:hypothetical protein
MFTIFSECHKICEFGRGLTGKAVEVGLNEGAGNLPGAIRTKVHEQDGVMILNTDGCAADL